MDDHRFISMRSGSRKGLIKRLFPMLTGEDDNAWATHAHPVSAWSRILLGLPLLILSGWSRVWIGDWWIAAIFASALFLWLNPRMTPVPRPSESWATQAIVGERCWITTKSRDLPRHHQLAPRVLIGFSVIGHFIVVIGVLRLDLAATGIGFVFALGAKLWFLDRMVWLAREDQEASRD